MLAPREQQRIDRWLWHARIVKTRTLAASLAASGHVRINGRHVGNAAHLVRKGDVLTVALPGTVRVLRAMQFSERRGKAMTAALLYEELRGEIAGP